MDRFRTALQLHKDQRVSLVLDHKRERLRTVKLASSHRVYQNEVAGYSTSVLRQRRVMAAYDKGPFVDAYKILRTQVMHRLRENNWNVLGVTSPGHGEGKTLTAVNLAVSLAMETSQTVLLVDADLRSPSIHEVFGLDDCPGLGGLLVGQSAGGGLVGASWDRPFRACCREDGRFPIQPRSSHRQKCWHWSKS